MPTICHHTANNHCPSKAIGHTSTTRFKDVGKVAKHPSFKITIFRDTPSDLHFYTIGNLPQQGFATFPTFHPPKCNISDIHTPRTELCRHMNRRVPNRDASHTPPQHTSYHTNR